MASCLGEAPFCSVAKNVFLLQHCTTAQKYAHLGLDPSNQEMACEVCELQLLVGGAAETATYLSLRNAAHPAKWRHGSSDLQDSSALQ